MKSDNIHGVTHIFIVSMILFYIIDYSYTSHWFYTIPLFLLISMSHCLDLHSFIICLEIR